MNTSAVQAAMKTCKKQKVPFLAKDLSNCYCFVLVNLVNIDSPIC